MNHLGDIIHDSRGVESAEGTFLRYVTMAKSFGIRVRKDNLTDQCVRNLMIFDMRNMDM